MKENEGEIKMRFGELPVGSEFTFEKSKVGYGTYSDNKTFVKISARKYQASGASAEREMERQRSLFGKKAKLPEYKIGNPVTDVFPVNSIPV